MAIFSRRDVVQHCVQHMVRSVETCQTCDDPYPHFYIENFFPAEIYGRILELLPETSLYGHEAEYRHFDKNGQPNRFNLELASENVAQLSAPAREFWLGIRDAMGSPLLKQAVFRQLARGLAIRFGIAPEEAAQAPGYPRPILMRELAGYRIKPHPDTRRKVVTFQVALPADESQVDLGTSLFQLSLSPLTLRDEFPGFRRVGRYPFLPNSAFAFAVINGLRLRSWHGRETLPEGCGIRNSLLSVYYGAPEDANAEIIAEQYQPLRRAA